MAPVHRFEVEARDLEPSESSSITLGSVAFVIIVVAIFWACVWPCLRKRYLNSRFPARTRFRDENHTSLPYKTQIWPWRRTAMFPSHPALLRNNPRQRLQPRLPVSGSQALGSSRAYAKYDETVNLLNLEHQSLSNHDTETNTSGQGIFKPTKNRLSAMIKWPASNLVATNRPQGTDNRVRSIDSVQNYGDAKEYILAIPEPLLLRNKSPVPERIPATNLQTLSSGHLDRSEHKPYPRIATDTITNDCTLQTKCIGAAPMTEEPDENRSLTSYISEVSTFAEAEGTSNVEPQPSSRAYSVADLSESSSESDNVKVVQNSKSVTALNRLKTYRSLTGAKPIRPLSRAGTLTRPKTPVAEIRNRYDGGISHTVFTSTESSITESFATSPVTDRTNPQPPPSTVRTSFDLTLPLAKASPTSLPKTSSSVITAGDVAAASAATSEFKKTHLSDAWKNLKTNENSRIKLLDQRNAVEGRLKSDPRYSSVSRGTMASRIPVATQRASLVEPVNSTNNFRIHQARRLPVRSSSIYSCNSLGFPILCNPGYSTFSHINEVGSTDPPRHEETQEGKAYERNEINVHRAESSRSANTRKKHSARNLVDSEAGSETSTISTELNSLDAEALRASLPRLCIRESDGISLRSCLQDGAEAVPADQNVIVPHFEREIDSESSKFAPGGARWI